MDSVAKMVYVSNMKGDFFMTIEMGLVLAGIAGIIGVLTYFSKKEQSDEHKGYRAGVIEEKLNNIEKKIDELCKTQEAMSKKVEDTIDTKIELHIQAYHKNN